MNWRRAWSAYAIWLVAASLLLGVGHTMQVGHALSRFGGEQLVPAVVGLTAVRISAAGVAALAACCAAVVGTHRGAAGNADSSWRGSWRDLAWVFGSVPLAAVAALMLILGSAAMAAAATYALPPATFVEELLRRSDITDPLHGLFRACLHAALLGAVAAKALPRLARWRCNLAVKVVVAWLGASAVLTLVDWVLGTAAVSG